MSDLTLLILRIGFLLLLWLFIFAVVYALRSDLFGAPVRKMPSESAPQPSAPLPPPAPPAPAPAALPTPITAPALAPTSPSIDAPTPQSVSSAPQTPLSSPQLARALVITSGVAAGTTMPLEDEFVTIGRSSDSDLVIVDEYTSTYHARLHRNGEQWILTDLDSTNGTKLDGVRVNGSTPVPVFTPITIGTTTFELRP